MDAPLGYSSVTFCYELRMLRQSPLIKALAICSSTLALAACIPTIGPSTNSPKQARIHALAGGEILVNAPRSYCVDTSSRPSSSFVLMTNCDVLAGTPKTNPADRGILTVSLGAQLTADQSDLELETLMGTGATQSPRVPGLIMQQVNASDTSRLDGAAAQYWRAAMKVQDRIVTLALYGPEKGSVIGAKGKPILEDLARGIQAKPLSDQATAKIQSQKTTILAFRRLFQINQ
ncbi:hypothetical protein TA5114_00519 [Cognatishimia activa]|uniref:Uncharacterized protein n=2 Tax=Cognatishimia activa TaxID=1715691 RepID=A0A0P1IM58_9RHOB|nr:hypothetical protein TA5113_00279 [Cognatishimia activa]CUK24733.1 hypothetical protein TA5114_00519 [Cognatishimia activa]